MILDELFLEAQKFSDLPPSMRKRLTMRDIEAERPQGAFRFRVITPQGDAIDFMSLDAAQSRAKATGGRVQSIPQHPDQRPTNISESILIESCHGLTLDQQKIVQGIYRQLRPLLEVQLTSDQINQLFGNVQQNAGRTMIGKGVDIAAKVNQTIDDVGKWLQDTRPVQAFDQKFDNLKNNISQKFPDLSRAVSQLGDWAKANPGKTAAIVGILTTIAALGAGPAGGAIAGQILRGTAELLKGEKLSTAVGKGIKTAAYGALAGYTINQIGDLISGGAQAVADNIFPGMQRLKMNFDVSGTGPGTFQNVTAVGRPEDIQQIRDTFNAGARAWQGQNYSQAQAMFDQARSMAKELADPDYVMQLTSDRQLAKTVLDQAKNLVAATDAVAAGAQGAIQASGQKPQPAAESRAAIYRIKRSQLTEHEVHDLFENVLDQLKTGASNLAAKAGQKISQVGQSLTNKVTSAALTKAWEKAGRPMDSEEIAAKVLRPAGVNDDVINQSFTAMQIPVPTTAARATPKGITAPGLPTSTGVPAGASSAGPAAASQASTAAAPGPVAGKTQATANQPTAQDQSGQGRQMVGINPQTGRPFLSPATDVAGPMSTPQAEPVSTTVTNTPTAQAEPVTAPQAEPVAATATANKQRTPRVGAPAGKAAIDQALQTVDKVRSDRRQGVIDYGQAELDAAEQRLKKIRRQSPVKAEPAVASGSDTFKPTTPTPAWAKGQPIKIGRQTITPRDPNYEKITKAISVTEALAWSKGFDPSLRLLSNIKKQP